MNNLLTAPVQSVRVVWYAPEGFPDVQTDAELVDDQGETLLVFTGMSYETILASQVKRTVSVRLHDSTMLLDEERADYDAQTE